MSWLCPEGAFGVGDDPALFFSDIVPKWKQSDKVITIIFSCWNHSSVFIAIMEIYIFPQKKPMTQHNRQKISKQIFHTANSGPILVQVTIYRRLLIRSRWQSRPIRSLRYIVTCTRIRALVYSYILNKHGISKSWNNHIDTSQGNTPQWTFTSLKQLFKINIFTVTSIITFHQHYFFMAIA